MDSEDSSTESHVPPSDLEVEADTSTEPVAARTRSKVAPTPNHSMLCDSSSWRIRQCQLGSDAATQRNCGDVRSDGDYGASPYVIDRPERFANVWRQATSRQE